MPVPKRKTSKMKKRMRKGANRYQGVEANHCTACGKPNLPHRACSHCGIYKGKQVITVGD